MTTDGEELHPDFDAPLRGSDFLSASHDFAGDLGLRPKQLESWRGSSKPESDYKWNARQLISRVASVRLPGTRDHFLRRYHRQLRGEYLNGGFVAGFYAYQLLEPPEPAAHLVCSLFHRLGADRLFPAAIAGCSAHPIEIGGLCERTFFEFAAQLYGAFRVGGAYSQARPTKDAFEDTNQYCRALIGPYEPKSLHYFELDPCFSLWFFDVAWDRAFVVIHPQESWAAILATTDTD